MTEVYNTDGDVHYVAESSFWAKIHFFDFPLFYASYAPFFNL